MTASPEFFKGKKKAEVRAYFNEVLDFMQKTSVKRHDHIRRGAYRRENAPYAPLFCPADRGQATQRQRNRWKQEKTDMVAG